MGLEGVGINVQQGKAELYITVCALILRVYISQIFHIRGFCVFKFADAGHCFVHIH